MNSDEILLNPYLSDESDNVIEFSGTICERARLDRANRISKIVVIPLAVIAALFIVAIVLCSVYSALVLLYIFAIDLVVVAWIIILLFFPIKELRLTYWNYLTYPITITFTEKTVTNSYFSKNIPILGTKSIDSVKRVLDVGEWYYIFFKTGDTTHSWVCQKDLLTKGTIEDFEKMFDGKIVRKTTNKS